MVGQVASAAIREAPGVGVRDLAMRERMSAPALRRCRQTSKQLGSSSEARSRATGAVGLHLTDASTAPAVDQTVAHGLARRADAPAFG
jgi:hypothetical protein